MSVARMRWPELDGGRTDRGRTDGGRADGPARGTLLVPVGSLEQHGPHLPLGTDTRIAEAVAAGVAGPDVLVAPAVGYGASGEHETFSGTVSIGHEALRAVLVELGRSACRWVARLVFVNGHGGNVPALGAAVRLLRAERREVAWHGCALPDADLHAGHTETALMLAVAAGDVRMERAAPGNTRSLAELLPAMRSGSVRAVSPSGVLGDPTTAGAAQGGVILAELVAALRSALARWQPEESGRLRTHGDP